MQFRNPHWQFVMVMALCGACSGTIAPEGLDDNATGGASSGDNRSGGKSGPEARIGNSCGTAQPLPQGRLRRLTRIELENTFSDLVGDPKISASKTLDLEPQSGIFYNGFEDLWADGPFMQKYIPLAQTVADVRVGWPGDKRLRPWVCARLWRTRVSQACV